MLKILNDNLMVHENHWLLNDLEEIKECLNRDDLDLLKLMMFQQID